MAEAGLCTVETEVGPEASDPPGHLCRAARLGPRLGAARVAGCTNGSSASMSPRWWRDRRRYEETVEHYLPPPRGEEPTHH